MTSDECTLLARVKNPPGQAEEAALLDCVPHAVFALDEEGHVTALNDSAELLFEKVGGRTRDELLGKAIWLVCPEVGDSILARLCSRAREERQAVEQETFYPALGRWFAVRVVPFGGRVAVWVQGITELTQPSRPNNDRQGSRKNTPAVRAKLPDR
jgi:PAS domain S-box-containing protein